MPTNDVGTSYRSLFVGKSINVYDLCLVHTAFGERIGPYYAFLGHSHNEMTDIRGSQHLSCHLSPGLYIKASLFTGDFSLPNTSSHMALTSLLLCAFSLALRSHGKPAALETRNSSDLLCTCDDIAAAISGASQVFFPRMSFSYL